MRVEVDPDVVAKVVSDWTGIPLGRVLRDQVRNVVNLEENLRLRIKGQDEAIGMIGEIVKASKAGLSDPRQPIGVFLFVGPSGVGKTETALAVADLLFGGDRFLTTINMSEFQEEHTVSPPDRISPGLCRLWRGRRSDRGGPAAALLGHPDRRGREGPPGRRQPVLPGLRQGDALRRRRPHHRLQEHDPLPDEQPGLGRDHPALRGEKRPSTEALVEAIRPVLSKHFKPALLARMTIVPYFTLDPSFMQEIVTLKLDRLVARMAENNKMKLTCSPEVVEQIAARCTEVETGARNIDHIMRGTILPQLSREILARLSDESMPTEVHLEMLDGAFHVRFAG